MNFFDPQLLFEKNIIQTISFIGAIQGLVLCVVVLFYPSEHKVSNRILSAFILSLSIILLYSRLVPLIGEINSWPIEGTKFSSLMLLYLYVKSIYRKIKWKQEWWHLAIAIGWTVQSYFFIRHHVEHQLPGGYAFLGSSLMEQVDLTLNFIIPTFYFFKLFRLHKEYRRKVILNFSSTDKVGLKWTKQLIWFHLILLLKNVVVLIHFLITRDAFLMPIFGLLNNVGFTAFMYFIAIKGKLSPDIYKLRHSENFIVKKNTSNEDENENLHSIAKDILMLFEVEKIHKEEGLSIKELAEKLNVQPYLVSQAINNILQKPFFELVNSFRVEEAKSLMTNSAFDHLSMVGIAFEAGFSSKTAFNIAFKKYTGQTPTAYKKANLERGKLVIIN